MTAVTDHPAGVPITDEIVGLLAEETLPGHEPRDRALRAVFVQTLRLTEKLHEIGTKPKNQGHAHSCDIPGCVVCDPCAGL